MRFAVLALERLERWTTGISLVIAVLCLVLLSCCCLYQVVSRFALEEPLDWSEALIRSLMIWAVFMAMPAAFREGAMVSVDILPKLIGAERSIVVGGLAGLTIILLAFVSWYGWAILPRVRFQTVAGLGSSIAWVYIAIPVGTTLSILSVLANAIAAQRSKISDKSLELGL
jgi:TRAP-type C4-dicarboxylate transport system permease small subunit